MARIYRNPTFIPIQDLKLMVRAHLDSIGDVLEQAESQVAIDLDAALQNSNNVNFKIIHPIFLKGYRMPSVRYASKPLNVVGVDIETNYKTGEPRLIGFYYTNTDTYKVLYRPTLADLFTVIHGLVDNDTANFVTWGNLDIQCLIRLFEPTEVERRAISRGLSANVSHGEFLADPPIVRMIGDVPFYLSHYMPGRSMKLGYIEREREHTIWVFNISQFYPGTIAQNANGLHIPWREFGRETHLIDWNRYNRDKFFQLSVHQSNKQDAVTVSKLAEILQERFFKVFDAYPTLLVSAGSLTDSAVSKMLSDDPDDYNSNSWKWLCRHVFGKDNELTIMEIETLLSEAFSAGYVDQFAVGYFPEICTADISSAYPDKIRNLPDLRYAHFVQGKNHLENDLLMVGIKFVVETAIIRGSVSIPDSLRYHPITLKNYNRENYRAIGHFSAAYTLEERRFCESYGATFSDEEYVIVALRERRLAPIAEVSRQLGLMREDLLTKSKDKENFSPIERIMYDGQQFMVKIVDNSIYGKTVMTTEVVENVQSPKGSSPQVTGYIAGDRYNLLYGTLITSRTRVQLAQAAMSIQTNGGVPVMCMTDSLYWYGKPDMLPAEMWTEQKTAGFFEKPSILNDFYILKTGQYEYREGVKWVYKMRGLSVDWEMLTGTSSFYRHLLKEETRQYPQFTHPKKISIRLSTRRLVTIGSHDLEKLGMIEEKEIFIRPFLLSNKNAESYILNWIDCIDGHVWLESTYIEREGAKPLDYLRALHTQRITADNELEHAKKAIYKQEQDKRLREYVMRAVIQTNKLPPEHWSKWSWSDIEEWFELPREEILHA